MAKTIGKGSQIAISIKGIFDWRDKYYPKHEALDLLHAHHYLGYKQNFIDKANGYLPYLPQIFLPYPRNGYHGLYIIVLGSCYFTQRKTMSKKRVDLSMRLINNGFKVVVADDDVEAIKVIKSYLGLKGKE